MSRSIVHSHTFPCSLPLAFESTPLFSDSSLDLSIQDNDPFLVKSPFSLSSSKLSYLNSDLSYDIKHLQDFHDIDPSWKEDDIEEIMIIRSKPRLPHIVKISNAHDVFHLLSVVGTGVAAKILLAKKPHSFKLYAIKRTRRSLLSDNTLCSYDAASEQQMLRTITGLNAPFLPRLYSSFSDSHHHYLVMDFCARGDLLTHLLKDGPLTPETAQFYASELVVGISSLHQAGIVHRDLKPENILVEFTGHIVITDFGCAKSLNSVSEMAASPTFCGTKEYQAPEVVLEWSHDFAVDIWGFGLILYLINFGEHPFMQRDGESDDTITTRQKIILGSVMPWRSKREETSPLVDLIGKALERNPALRPKIGEIKDHCYFSPLDWNLISSKQIPVPLSRILDSSNIHIPLNSIASEFFPSSETLGDTVNSASDGFAFEWEGASEDNFYDVVHGTRNPVCAEHVPSFEHVPTLLNAIQEDSEGSEDLRRSLASTSISPPVETRPQECTTILIEDVSRRKDRGNIFDHLVKLYYSSVPGLKKDANTCRPTGSSTCKSPIPLQTRPRNKLRKKTRPVKISLPVPEPTSSLNDLGPRVSVTITSPLCLPGRIFSGKNITRKKHSDGRRSADDGQIDHGNGG